MAGESGDPGAGIGVDGCTGHLLPQAGILSTPAIDTAGKAIYVVSETFESGLPVFRLHALSLITGREMFNGPTVITASVAGAGVASANGTIHI